MKTVVSENFLRVALIAFNFIFSILSVSLIALGVVYAEQLSYVKPYIGAAFLKFPTLLLILGCLSFVVSIAGCYCARSTNRRHFILFLLILACLLALEFAIAVIAFMNIDAFMANSTSEIMLNQVESSDFSENGKFHKIEEVFDCCGINGPKDYLENNWPEYSYMKCCGVHNCKNELLANSSELWSQKGCANVVTRQTQQIAKEAAAVGSIYSSLQILEMGCVFLMQGMVISYMD